VQFIKAVRLPTGRSQQHLGLHHLPQPAEAFVGLRGKGTERRRPLLGRAINRKRQASR